MTQPRAPFDIDDALMRYYDLDRLALLFMSVKKKTSRPAFRGPLYPVSNLPPLLEIDHALPPFVEMNSAQRDLAQHQVARNVQARLGADSIYMWRQRFDHIN